MTTRRVTLTQFKCNFAGCNQTFSRNTDCLRHQSEKHGPLRRCKECDYAVKRDGRLIAHCKKVHGYRGDAGAVPLIVPDNFTSQTSGQNAIGNQSPETEQSTTANNTNFPLSSWAPSMIQISMSPSPYQVQTSPTTSYQAGHATNVPPHQQQTWQQTPQSPGAFSSPTTGGGNAVWPMSSPTTAEYPSHVDQQQQYSLGDLNLLDVGSGGEEGGWYGYEGWEGQRNVNGNGQGYQ